MVAGVGLKLTCCEEREEVFEIVTEERTHLQNYSDMCMCIIYVPNKRCYMYSIYNHNQ